MAKNKITFEHEWDGSGRKVYRFTGSQRQPNLNEVLEFLRNEAPSGIEDEIMVYGLAYQSVIDGYQGFDLVEPEESKTLEFWGYTGGLNGDSCPICGHERDMNGDKCPVCFKPWG